MKKGVLVCAVFLVMAGLVSAPVAAATKFNFGLKVGASFANNLWTDDDGSEKTLVRPTFGVFADFNLTDMIALQPEINYVTMGEWWDDVGKVVETFNYIHIPLLLKVRLMKEGKIVPFLLAGPSLGVLLSAKEAGFDIKPFFKSTDFGADFGGGAEFAAGKMKVLVDIRYLLGLTNVLVQPPIEALMLARIDFGMKNRAFAFTAGILF